MLIRTDLCVMIFEGGPGRTFTTVDVGREALGTADTNNTIIARWSRGSALSR
jgi:hypothetical protein